MILGKLWKALAAQMNKVANYFWTADPIAQLQYEYDKAVDQMKEGREGLEQYRALVERVTRQVNGDREHVAQLEARIKALGLEGSIELPGASSEPANILRHSDLFVLPSREEGMSIALLEAMALGIPLVATAIPGNIRLIPNNETGRLAEPDDPLDIAQAIIDQWTDFDAAQAMARTARRRVIDTYSIEAVARRHLEMFKQLSDRNKKARNHSAEFSEA